METPEVEKSDRGVNESTLEQCVREPVAGKDVCLYSLRNNAAVCPELCEITS